MTSSRFLPFCSLVFGSMIGCATHPDEGNQTVDYQLHGQIVVATAHIDADGTFTRTTRGGTMETGKLSTIALEDLQSEVEQAQFPTLEAVYFCGGCVDLPVNTITVLTGGATYSVRANDFSGYPERLQPLIDRLKALVMETPE